MGVVRRTRLKGFGSSVLVLVLGIGKGEMVSLLLLPRRRCCL